VDIRDTKDIHDYLESKNLVCSELRTKEQLEGAAHYFGVEESRNLPVNIKIRPLKIRKPKEPLKSSLSKAEMKALRESGMTLAEIAKMAGISKQAVCVHTAKQN